MCFHLVNGHEARQYAENWCIKNEYHYLSHEYYYHSNGNWNHLKIAVEDFSGRYEVDLDLNKLKEM